jgi:hypothetical protein
MLYTIAVNDEELKCFLKSIITHSSQKFVKGWLKQMGLKWKNYWDLPQEARPFLIKALLWAEVFPTLPQIQRIIWEETRQSPKSAILKSQETWWSQSEEMKALLEQFYQNLTQDQFLSLVRKGQSSYAWYVLKFCTKELLPLAMGIAPHLDTIISTRLAGKKMED